jgi:uncharacterized ubiquitin-like protein YukD
MFKLILTCVLICSVFICSVVANAGGISVVANVRGKKYTIVAETVAEFTEKAEAMAELEAGQQSVLFRGKVLSPEDRLADIGVEENDVLNVLKGRKPRAAASADALDSLDLEEESVSQLASGGMPQMPGMPANMDPEQMDAAMKQMDALLDSNFVDEYFGDEEKLEKARLNMLDNLDQFDNTGMPGFKEQAKDIASSPEKWREAMNTAKNQIMDMKKQRDAARAADTQPQE